MQHRSGSSLKEISSQLESQLINLFSDLQSGISAREDSRAFGAMVEKRITENWKSICSDCNLIARDLPGRRTIFDFAYEIDGQLIGIDVKTKDLDSAKYSDGGICAVGNLLKFLANDQGVFLIAEFGHTESVAGTGLRDLEYIHVAPFILLPQNAYRIENLGTGQVRLNYSINQVYEEIEWERDIFSFYDMFTDLAITHYQRVGRDAQKRIESINKFREEGYQRFAFAR